MIVCFSFLTLNMCLQSDKIPAMCSVAYTVNDTVVWFVQILDWYLLMTLCVWKAQQCTTCVLRCFHSIWPWSLFKHQNMQVVLLFSLSSCTNFLKGDGEGAVAKSITLTLTLLYLKKLQIIGPGHYVVFLYIHLSRFIIYVDDTSVCACRWTLQTSQTITGWRASRTPRNRFLARKPTSSVNWSRTYVNAVVMIRVVVTMIHVVLLLTLLLQFILAACSIIDSQPVCDGSQPGCLVLSRETVFVWHITYRSLLRGFYQQ